MKRLLILATAIVCLPAFALDTDQDGVPDAKDPAPNDIHITGYTPPWIFSAYQEDYYDDFGFAVTSADINGDGHSDIIASTPDDDNNATNSGSVTVFSGADGSVLYVFNGDSSGDKFGWAIDNAGDVNADGRDDLIVGAPFDDNSGADAGSARIISGMDGSILYTFNGDAAGDGFGWSVSGAGDIDQDGYGDVVVGAPSDSTSGYRAGSVRILSGRDGHILFIRNGDNAEDLLGNFVTGLGDMNNDGFREWAASAPMDDNTGLDSGTVRVFSGLDGSTLYNFYGDSEGDLFGFFINDAGDVNGDGHADLIIGAPYDDNNESYTGTARVMSGANGSILYNLEGSTEDESFGFYVNGAGDINKDGHADFIVGLRFAAYSDTDGTRNGRAYVYSGMNGQIIYALFGDRTVLHFGGPVSSAGDVDNDGYPDLLVGTAFSEDFGGGETGMIRVFSGALLTQQNTDQDSDGEIDTLDMDDDNDSLPDAWELDAGLDWLNAGDATTDPDNDGLDNITEFNLGSNPQQTDSDHDGIPDPVDPAPADINTTGYAPPSLYTVYGDSSDDAFATSIACAADMNGDGISDLIAGAPGDDNNGSNSGSARIISGNNGATLYTLNGSAANEGFGSNPESIGDIDGDNHSDFAVGAPNANANGTASGSIRLFSGATGNPLFSINGPGAYAYFGRIFSAAGDVNNDGYEDIIAGLPEDNSTGQFKGAARIFSGADGSLLRTLLGNDTYGRFGYQVSGIADINHDGHGELAISAPFDDHAGLNAGAVYVFSGQDGTLLRAIYGNHSEELLGYSYIVNGGDIDADGVPDLLVSSSDTYDPILEYVPNRMKVFSGSNGGLLHSLASSVPGERLGSVAMAAGDINKDGHADIIVGSSDQSLNGRESGSVHVISGADASTLYFFNGDSAYFGLGNSICGNIDINSDGYPDIAAGTSMFDNRRGLLRVYSGAMFLQQTMDTDGDGLANTLDTDDDGDNLPDLGDAFPLDSDNDGIDNPADPDDDNDGIPDVVDSAPLDPGLNHEIILPLDATYRGSRIREYSSIAH